MKILLDTQTFIWLVNEDASLGNNARTYVYDQSNELKLSYFSVFEMTIKASIGKLNYDASLLDDIPKMGIELLLPGSKALVGYTIFNPDKKDPFDNALILTALRESYFFLTSDSKILNTNTNGLQILDATR